MGIVNSKGDKYKIFVDENEVFVTDTVENAEKIISNIIKEISSDYNYNFFIHNIENGFLITGYLKNEPVIHERTLNKVFYSLG